MKTTVYFGRVRSDFFLKGIKGEKQYVKGQWVEGDLRNVMGRRMFMADGFFFNPQRFDKMKVSSVARADTQGLVIIQEEKSFRNCLPVG